MDRNPSYGEWYHSRPKRIEIDLKAPPNSKAETLLLTDVGVEVPRINYEAYNGKYYSFNMALVRDASRGAGAQHRSYIVMLCLSEKS